ncbi:Phage integrase [Plesiocystis pacifica SIR-1]|uniref:Phage integrase n=1 Tax=Plesiocystis pacifica SIR-1 TaxID=391625 RepID=A6GIP0_9BACT|nr:site-specific integrase [Plesiocystis pacifica]EDM74262.1 Phage integrase [Plesiocystis pacifica SIR-1]
MSVRKRKWRDKQGRQHERWMVHIEHTWPDGRKQTIRKVSPVQTKRGAEQYERELRKQLVSGEILKGGAKRRKVPTLKEFSEEFLAYQATMNKPGVIDWKKSILRTHLLPALGRRRLDAIDERVIDAFKVSQSQLELAPKTVNDHLKLLGRMLRVAKRWKLISEVPEIVLPKLAAPSFDFLDFKEAKLFLEGAWAYELYGGMWPIYMVVAMRTGLRLGEMKSLRWREDLDLDRGRVRVQRSHSDKHGFASPKNGKSRDVPLTLDALEALRSWRGQARGELVFSQLSSGEPLRHRQPNNAVKAIAKSVGLRQIHTHVLRHTFASHAVMRGIPMRQVQEWLGHSSIVVTMRYAHLADGMGDAMIQRLDPSSDGDQRPDAE